MIYVPIAILFDISLIFSLSKFWEVYHAQLYISEINGTYVNTDDFYGYVACIEIYLLY